MVSDRPRRCVMRDVPATVSRHSAMKVSLLRDWATICGEEGKRVGPVRWVVQHANKSGCCTVCPHRLHLQTYAVNASWKSASSCKARLVSGSARRSVVVPRTCALSLLHLPYFKRYAHMHSPARPISLHALATPALGTA